MKKLSRAEMKTVLGGFNPGGGCAALYGACSMAPNPPSYAQCCPDPYIICYNGRCSSIEP